MNLAELKKIVDDVVRMIEDKDISLPHVKVRFKTFDERFEENADEFQEPNEITSVEVDVLKWNSVTITIERKIEPKPGEI
jgi:hypothetical protein